MKRTLLLMSALVITGSTLVAQTTDLGGPVTWKSELKSIGTIPTKKMQAFDLAAVKAEDEINDLDKAQPWRFGYKFDTDFTLTNAGSWENLADGSRVWRLAISSAGALTMNFLLEDLYLPAGSSLYFFDKDHTNRVGAYTQRNNREDGMLGTELVHGDNVIVEYHEPANAIGQGSVTIANVIHGYRSITHVQDHLMKALNNSGDCNIDVNCPLGDLWNNQARAVAMIVVGGGGICTGALINNTCNDGKPYFLTADHCVGTSTSNWAFRFNWEVPDGHATLSCATTVNSASILAGTAYYDQSANGATLLASSAGSDFALLEIDNMDVDDAINWGLFYAGWNNNDAESGVTSAIGIHHPSGDIKKICAEEDAPHHEAQWGAQLWWIDEWEEGVTEGGSSGSPLFDQEGRIIGQLFGGASACNGTSNNGSYDFYGRFGVSWNLGLKNYLAPTACGTIPQYNYGYDPEPTTASVEQITADVLTVSPNPSKGIFTITLAEFSENAEIIVLDMTGREIRRQSMSNGVSALLDLSSMANGPYILRLNSTRGSETKTLIINK